MPWTGLVKTYNTNTQTPDSAGTATAMNTGHKTKAVRVVLDPYARACGVQTWPRISNDPSPPVLPDSCLLSLDPVISQGLIGINDNVSRGECLAIPGNELTLLAEQVSGHFDAQR